MRAELFPIPDCPVGRLVIMPRPRAGDWLEDKVRSWQRQGLDVVVSLLEDDEITELGLQDEAGWCEAIGLPFLHFPVPDRGVPSSREAVSQLVDRITSDLHVGYGVGIHCRIGVGRSAFLAVCVLGVLGQPLDAAWASVARARGLSVPDTATQREWVADWLREFRGRFP